jgi:hypothetical protein
LRARRRRVLFDALRQILVVDGLPDRLRQPFLARVDAAHDALQFRELEHHVGDEVGLGQPGRLRGRVGGCRASAPRAPANTSVTMVRASVSMRSALSR